MRGESGDRPGVHGPAVPAVNRAGHIRAAALDPRQDDAVAGLDLGDAGADSRTMPLPSWPRQWGRKRSAPRWPRTSRSWVWQTPLKATSTRTCPGFRRGNVELGHFERPAEFDQNGGGRLHESVRGHNGVSDFTRWVTDPQPQPTLTSGVLESESHSIGERLHESRSAWRGTTFVSGDFRAVSRPGGHYGGPHHSQVLVNSGKNAPLWSVHMDQCAKPRDFQGFPRSAKSGGWSWIPPPKMTKVLGKGHLAMVFDP